MGFPTHLCVFMSNKRGHSAYANVKQTLSQRPGKVGIGEYNKDPSDALRPDPCHELAQEGGAAAKNRSSQLPIGADALWWRATVGV